MVPQAQSLGQSWKPPFWGAGGTKRPQQLQRNPFTVNNAMRDPSAAEPMKKDPRESHAAWSVLTAVILDPWGVPSSVNGDVLYVLWHNGLPKQLVRSEFSARPRANHWPKDELCCGRATPKRGCASETTLLVAEGVAQNGVRPAPDFKARPWAQSWGPPDSQLPAAEKRAAGR